MNPVHARQDMTTCAVLTSLTWYSISPLAAVPLLRKGKAQEAESWETQQCGLYQCITSFRDGKKEGPPKHMF